MNYAIICRHLGLLLIVVSGCMGAPMAWWLGATYRGADTDPDVILAFGITIAVGVLTGGVLAWLGRRPDGNLRRKEALLLVAVSWLAGAALAALPFRLWAALHTFAPGQAQQFGSWIDCYFEAMSGLSTTGATILTAIGEIPQSLLFWRAMTQWLGGLGIVVLFVAVLPMLGVGGKRLFRIESPGPTPEGVTPRIHSTAQLLWLIYVFLTIAETLLLRYVAGMSWFDAICHTFTTLSTGGFSTLDSSVGGFHSGTVELILIGFMILAGVNFGLYFQLLQGHVRTFRRDPELRAYGLILAVAAILVIGSLVIARSPMHITDGTEQTGALAAIRHGVFQVVSILTTTGFCTADFNLWPFAAKATLITLMFIGGSAGSTAGGIKVVRCVMAVKIVWAELEHVFRPKVVRPVRMGRVTVDSDLRLATLVYVVGIGLVFAVGTIAIGVIDDRPDMTFITAATACAATLNNIGPGLGLVGATETYAHFNAPTKCILSLLMAIGRLEMFPILLLLMPRFWRSE